MHVYKSNTIQEGSEEEWLVHKLNTTASDAGNQLNTTLTGQLN